VKFFAGQMGLRATRENSRDTQGIFEFVPDIDVRLQLTAPKFGKGINIVATTEGERTQKKT